MTALKSILVDEDPIATLHPALEQVVRLARRCDARMKIVDVLPWVPSGLRHFVTPGIEKELVDHRREHLAALADDVSDIPVTTELLRGRPATAVIQEVLRGHHDLLVRSHGRDLAESPRPFVAIDMELLRQCPCPVWLIDGRRRATDRWRILAAIRATAAEPEEQELNAQILEWALLLQSLGDAELTVLQAWTPYGASLLRSRMSTDEFSEVIETSRRTHQAMGIHRVARSRLGQVVLEPLRGRQAFQLVLRGDDLGFGHPILAHQHVACAQRLPFRERRVELKRAMDYLHVIGVIAHRKRPFEAALAEIAPRADQVGPDVDAHLTYSRTSNPAVMGSWVRVRLSAKWSQGRL